MSTETNARRLKVKTEIVLPQLPNFIRMAHVSVMAPAIDVADFDDETLRTIGVAWADALVEHAQARRKARGEV